MSYIQGGGSVSDGDKGDVTVSGSGATWTIDNDAVTYAKIQNVTDARLLGRSAGSNGDAQEVTVGIGLTLASAALAADTQIIWKTADETVNNSATLQDDDHLTVSLLASSTYWFQFELFYSTAAAADFQFVPAYTGTTTNNFHLTTFSVPAGTTSTREEVHTSFAGYSATATTGTHGYVKVEGIYQTNATGTLKMQWAQNTADVSDTKVLKGSRLLITKMP